MTAYPEKLVLFSGPPDAVEEAKAYCRDNGYSHDDVRIVRRDDEVLVMTKREGVEA